MPVRFRVLPAARDVREAWAAAGSSGVAEGPSEERSFEIVMDLDELRIGRHQDAEIELPFPAVSTLHARLLRGELPSDWRLEDLGSLNGTWLDGQRLSPRRAVPIRAGQRLRIAAVDLIFEGWSATPRQVPGQPQALDGTATIARRLISDLFGAVGGEVPRLVVESGLARSDHRELALAVRERRYLAGRADSCDLVLAGEHVSREHAAFIRGADGIVLQDLGSRNGLLVNRQVVSGERRLADGDVVMVGTASLRLIDPEDRYLRRLQTFVPNEAMGSLSLAPPPAPESGPPDHPPVTPDASAGSSLATDLPRPARSWGGLANAVIAAVALAAIAGLVALWLTTH